MICSTSVIMLNLRYKLMAIDCIYGPKIRLLKKFKALTSRRRGERLQHDKLPRHKWLAESIKALPSSDNAFHRFTKINALYAVLEPELDVSFPIPLPLSEMLLETSY